jgi:hypothetical protein
MPTGLPNPGPGLVFFPAFQQVATPALWLQSVDAASTVGAVSHVQVGKGMAATSVALLAVQRQMGKVLAGTSMATLGMSRQIGKGMAVVLAAGVVVQKQTTHLLAALSAIGAGVQKQITKALSATSAIVPGLVAGFVKIVALVASTGLAVTFAVLRMTPLASRFMPKPDDPWRKRPGD